MPPAASRRDGEQATTSRPEDSALRFHAQHCRSDRPAYFPDQSDIIHRHKWVDRPAIAVVTTEIRLQGSSMPRAQLDRLSPVSRAGGPDGITARCCRAPSACFVWYRLANIELQFESPAPASKSSAAKQQGNGRSEPAVCCRCATSRPLRWY